MVCVLEVIKRRTFTPQSLTCRLNNIIIQELDVGGDFRTWTGVRGDFRTRTGE